MSISCCNNTTVTNGSQSQVDEVFPSHVDNVIQGIYVIITLTGICGNSLVLYLVLAKRVERSTFSLLLANLSFADLVADISLYPYVFIDLRGFNVNEFQGSVLCNFTIGLTIFFTCTAVSLFTLTTISINRCISINHPLRFEWQQSRQCVLYFIPFTWLIGIITLTPNFISFSYKKDLGICRRQWPQGINGSLYSLLTAFFGLIVPIMVLILTFFSTLKSLRVRVYNSTTLPALRNSRRKTIRLLGWLILVFSICWVPFFCYWFLSRATDIFDNGYEGDFQRMRVIRLTILFASMNTAIDPIMYALFSEQYRGALRRLVRSNAAVAPMNSTITLNTILSYKRHAYVTSSEKSSFSARAIDEEFKDRTTPTTSTIMEAIRGLRSSPNVDEINN